MLVEENVSRFAPPKHPKVAKYYSDLVTVQAKRDVQLHFHVLKNTLSLVLLCVLRQHHPDTWHHLQGTML